LHSPFLLFSFLSPFRSSFLPAPYLILLHIFRFFLLVLYIVIQNSVR
jgi:hypothetical protein